MKTFVKSNRKWSLICLSFLILFSFSACRDGSDNETLDESETTEEMEQEIEFPEGVKLELPVANDTLLSVVASSSGSDF